VSTTSAQNSIATVYGYPRQGANRELKKITEAYWSGRADATTLLAATRELRLARLAELRDAGLGEIPSNEFSLYDHVLDTSIMLGAIPARHHDAVPDVSTDEGQLARYFAMARGTDEVAPLEMTKWFNTNYHYLVPELGPFSLFRLNATKPLAEFNEAREIGIITRPVILGPVTYLLLAKPAATAPAEFEPLDLLESLVPRYDELLRELHDAGAQWVQIDEPILVTDLSAEVLARVGKTYQRLGALAQRPKILVASYFDRLGDALAVLAATPVEGLAMDFTGSATANLEELAAIGGIPDKRLVAGVIGGHNVWTTDLTHALSTLATLLGLAGRVDVSASCSLLHVPLDVTLETDLDHAVEPWLAFARQKLHELSTLAYGLAHGRSVIAAELQANRLSLDARATSPIVHIQAVRDRIDAVGAKELKRATAYERRRAGQARRLGLPPLPTTTIGSFPQTTRLRQARADLVAKRIDQDEYGSLMRQEIAEVITLQEELGLDVLVHGEAERNDMVQYFAEQLDGFLATRHGWVQSYGTRYVRPPIIVGDVSRPRPMTVRWTTFAQSLTDRPVKGMLTGPVTMLAWSFVRDDQPLSETARQVALALRDEVIDLEAAGTAVIQVDEPALRETLPLRESDRADYLAWAVDAFRLTTAGVRDDTQIHTHMCYCEFGDVLNAIIAMDADVISLEAARSEMSIVADLARTQYQNEIGPGVWDIHSPRVPSVDEISGRVAVALSAVVPDRLWINPDCGLKTRGYPEVRETLANLVEATRLARAGL
jgi:5-methyltetrahydropteroyltriglutamate--homocysteine methyltransferase